MRKLADQIGRELQDMQFHYLAEKRPSVAGEFIEFVTGREAIKLVGDLRLSQAVSRALYDRRATWADAARQIVEWRFSTDPVPARPTETCAPDGVANSNART